jgi:hypothetical protein
MQSVGTVSEGAMQAELMHRARVFADSLPQYRAISELQWKPEPAMAEIGGLYTWQG